MDNLFSTHPNTANRIAELEQLSANWSEAPATARAAPERGRGGPWG
jgi:predicted Zn-dependent protease